MEKPKVTILKDLVKQYPNDAELGREVRKHVTHEMEVFNAYYTYMEDNDWDVSGVGGLEEWFKNNDVTEL